MEALRHAIAGQESDTHLQCGTISCAPVILCEPHSKYRSQQQERCDEPRGGGPRARHADHARYWSIGTGWVCAPPFPQCSLDFRFPFFRFSLSKLSLSLFLSLPLTPKLKASGPF